MVYLYTSNPMAPPATRSGRAGQSRRMEFNHFTQLVCITPMQDRF